MATFRQLKSGRWQARVYVDSKYKSIGTFPTKKEAEIKAAEIERKLFYGETFVDRNMVFQEVIDKWFEYRRSTQRDSTYEQTEVVKRLHIEPFFGHRKLFNIKAQDIEEWVMHYYKLKDKKGNYKYSFRTIVGYLVTLKDVFNYAIYNLDLISKNPAAKVRVPARTKTENEEIKYYTLEELNKLLDYLENYEPPRFKEYNPYYMLVLFLSRTGLRISEALALRWSDIKGDKVIVEKQTSRDDNNNLKITSLKTLSSYRIIKIDELLVEELAKFKRIQNKCVLKYKGFKRNKDMIIFQTWKGNYYTPSDVRETLERHCENAGVEYKGTHCFRHTHAVLSLEAGATLEYISKRLGHKSIKTTADTYLDITDKIESSELNIVTSYLDGLDNDMAQKWHDNKINK